MRTVLFLFGVCALVLGGVNMLTFLFAENGTSVNAAMWLFGWVAAVVMINVATRRR